MAVEVDVVEAVGVLLADYPVREEDRRSHALSLELLPRGYRRRLLQGIPSDLLRSTCYFSPTNRADPTRQPAFEETLR